MAASAADIRSALSIPEATASKASHHTKKPVQSVTRKPDGIPRELYSLIGPSAPSLQAHLAKPRLKQKPNFGVGGTKTKWELKRFKNSARKDNLELAHWEKVSVDPVNEYAFAKYDVHPNIWTYSDEEYAKIPEGQDSTWTKEETDYLFSITKDYDLRWYVIHDRYEFPGGRVRSLEDLKDRYFSVCRKLVRNQMKGDEAAKAQLLASYQFDKERELTRKKYIESLEKRTPDQIAEEEALYIEVRRLEQNERKFKREREHLLRTLAGMDSGLPDVTEDDPVAACILNDGSSGFLKTKKRRGTIDDSPSTPVTTSTPSALRRSTPSVQKNVVFDAQNCIIRTDAPATAIATKAAHLPAYLRSFRLPTPKAAHAPKINQALAELGISTGRLVMPTRENIAGLETLMESTTALLELKRTADKLDYEIQVAKKQLGIKDESQDVDGRVDGDGMDVDDAQLGGETEGEEGRAQSILSARSGRSRKHSRRSVSVSSVDTVSTRAGTKRQKRG